MDDFKNLKVSPLFVETKRPEVKITRYTKIQNERSQTLVFESENVFENDEEGLRDTY